MCTVLYLVSFHVSHPIEYYKHIRRVSTYIFSLECCLPKHTQTNKYPFCKVCIFIFGSYDTYKDGWDQRIRYFYPLVVLGYLFLRVTCLLITFACIYDNYFGKSEYQVFSVMVGLRILVVARWGCSFKAAFK